MKHDRLRSKANGSYRDKHAFRELRGQNVKTERAWRIKETASGLWSFSCRGVTERIRKALLGWIA